MNLAGVSDEELMAEANRLLAEDRYSHRLDTPGTLAAWLTDGAEMQAPHLDVIDQAFVDIAENRRRNVLITLPPRHGKLVDHDELVPTPDGWRRHGDLAVGDQVFHPSGRAIRVTALGDDGEAWLRVTTSDGGSVVVHPAHEWTVYDRRRLKWRTLETADLQREQLRLADRHTIQLPDRGALDGHGRPLPMDPYTLGVWLGDGSTTTGAITHAPTDQFDIPYPQTARCVHSTTGVITTYYGQLKDDLRSIGVLGDKHIPPEFLWAGEQDRWSLLEGLIDTDGSVGSDGRVRFINTNRRLIEDVETLIRSLGYRTCTTVTEPCTSTSGITGTKQVLVVGFSPYDGRIPARLARKAGKAKGSSMHRRTAIVSIDPVEPRPGRCITVDSPDGLYLVGQHMIPTHNSRRAARWAALWFLARFPNRRVIVASHGGDLAAEHGRWVRDMIESASDPKGADLGLRLDPSSNAADRWDLLTGDASNKGGMRTVGVGGSITGRGAHLIIVDDPVKDAETADAPLYRYRQWEWWTQTLLTRREPGAALCLIQTRWHMDDLAGRVLEAAKGQDE